MQDVTSKSFDGITDLVVVAPIKEEFIEAFENISYATRLELTAEALNRVRIAAREHERLAPFTDVTERILTLLDFRIGVLDKDIFGLTPDGEKVALTDPGGTESSFQPQKAKAKRFLYLTATFDGGWEPYMRLIWRPMGAFLDLLFCNCEGYVTATEHGCDEYLQWVRDNLVDSNIFYATTGLTIRDQRYLSQLERIVRADGSDSAIAAHIMTHPDPEAARTRAGNPRKTVELGLEALNVLYKLADFYPPEWLTGRKGGLAKLGEGHRLVRATAEILRGFGPMLPSLPEPIRNAYLQPLEWFETGVKEVARLDAIRDAATRPDPEFAEANVQGGIIKAHGSATQPVRHGALLLFTIRDATAARAFIKGLPISFAGEVAVDNAVDDGTARMFHSIAFTSQGLLRMGAAREVVDCFPKEFRDGMAARSGILGDMRENHPRNWILPRRHWAGPDAPTLPLPPVELDEVDFVIDLRASGIGSAAAVTARIAQIAALAAAGASLEAVERTHSTIDPATGLFRDYFGYLDGISQPRPPAADGGHPDGKPARDRVSRGEVFVGYGNDRGDDAPGPYATLEDSVPAMRWRGRKRQVAQALMHDGSFLVVRKIGQDADEFARWVTVQAGPIASRFSISQSAAEALIRDKMMGRDASGRPLIPGAGAHANDFDYGGDARGLGCPHAAHIRRANPRRTQPPLPPGATPEQRAAHVQVEAEFGRPTPRILRRGMLFDDGAGAAGMMFMAYNASIAEQYETIQRWMNGGNSTDIVAAHNDPLTGVLPREGNGVFRFAVATPGGEQVVTLTLPPAVGAADAPGRHPFAPMHWGLYLFTPSRAALETLCGYINTYAPLPESLEKSVGLKWIERVSALDVEEAAKEWKRLLEDFVVKDPTERNITPHLWAAIRWYYGGAINLERSVAVIDPQTRVMSNRVIPGIIKNNPPALAAIENALLRATLSTPEPHEDYSWTNPDRKNQNVVLVASHHQAMQVLQDWEHFSIEEQLRRITDTSGPIYVAQQPDNKYKNPALNDEGLDYHKESFGTNEVLFAVDEQTGFEAGYTAGIEVLTTLKRLAEGLGRTSFKLELRRQYLQEAIGILWRNWYGLPDDKQEIMHQGGWSWKRIVSELSEADPAEQARTKPRCPGDFLASSRATFYPRPTDAITAFGTMHGQAILRAAEELVARYPDPKKPPTAPIAQKLFKAVHDPKILARNIAGTMVGAIPPMEANLRSIILDWLLEKTLWRHQSALRVATGGTSAEGKFAIANAVLRTPISQAICKRPAPDLLFRTVTKDVTIPVNEGEEHPLRKPVHCKEGDLVVVSLVSVAQRSLKHSEAGDVSIAFGGKRTGAMQGYDYAADGSMVPVVNDSDNALPVHACPAQKMSMGAMMGIMAALLDSGTIQPLPAALIVRISDW